VILAGGFGTRLRAALTDRPKVLAPVAGRPFLDYLLDYLAGQAIHKVILSVGYLADQVRNYAAAGQRWGLELSYAREDAPLGTAGGIKLASQAFEEPFFALNGDTLFQVELAELWQCFLRLGTEAAIALRKVPAGSGEQAARGAVRLLSGENCCRKIVEFTEKPVGGNQAERIASEAAEAWTNGGIYVLTPQALAEVPLGQAISIERQVFPALAARGQLAGCQQDGYFMDIGTPESLAAFEQDVIKGLYHVGKFY
jgi:NDP-sugar pyrophosphorylase family protein